MKRSNKMTERKNERLLFAGTYSETIKLGTGEVVKAKGEGIYTFRMDKETGMLTLLSKAPGEPNPSFVALDKTQKWLYSTNELKTYKGLVSGACTSFSLDKETGKLTYMNRVATGGTDAVHCILNKACSHLLVANFMSGSVTVVPINREDGTLEPPSCFLQHYGTGPNPIRQTGPHAHAFELDKDEKRAFVPDLGSDRVYIYNINWETGHLSENDPPYVQLLPGEGPRHCTFDESGKFLYVINEMGNSIYVYEYDNVKGSLKEIQQISTIPEGYPEHTTCSAIKFHPNGNFLYGSNRGHDSLATYRVDHETGRLTLVSIQKTGGRTPRDFDFTPDGKFLVAGNQDSNCLVVFSVNVDTGEITPIQKVDDIFTVTCIKIYDMI